MVVLISISLVLSQAQVYTVYMRQVHYTVCLFIPQLSLILIEPTHEGMARLS